MKHLLRAEISAAALRHNLQRVRSQAPGRKVMAVIKANAYGHGLVSTALCLADADAFAVARLEEALALRAAGVRTPIVLLEGVFSAGMLEEAARQDLQIVVHDAAQLLLLEQSLAAYRFVVWLKVDTGMNRLGFRPEAFPAAYARLRALDERLGEIRLLTHFASADAPDLASARQQLQRFETLTQGLNHARSLVNSAALFALPAAQADWVRPGLALYGVSPFADRNGASLGLRPAMRLLSTVISIRAVPIGETVGYGGSWRADRNSRIAIVAAGYGDGLPWSLPSGTLVRIGERTVPLVGRVSMDMIAVDATDTAVNVGDAVELWGEQQSVEALAASAGTIAYELLCAVSQRVPTAVV